MGIIFIKRINGYRHMMRCIRLLIEMCRVSGTVTSIVLHLKMCDAFCKKIRLSEKVREDVADEYRVDCHREDRLFPN